MTDQIPPISESTKLNFMTSIWIVPAMALLIAMWLALEHFSDQGPEIMIYFEKNQGLKVERSQIRYKNISIGKVVDIQLQEDEGGIIVIANINKKDSDLLYENNKFWIVKPEFSLSEISGLETLISGTYIDMHKGNGDKGVREFKGLNHAYRDTSNGYHYELTASSAYGLEIGAPVFYKTIKVGELEESKLSTDGSKVHFTVFIEKRYVPYVHTDSKFWVKSAANVALRNGGLSVDVTPFSALFSGGIVLSDAGSGDIALDGSQYELFGNTQAAHTSRLGQGGKFIETFEIHTTTPTVNLNVGVSVKYGGYQVGEVKSITPYYDGSLQLLKSKVLLEIDLSSFANSSEPEMGKTYFYQAVKRGLRATISSTNPIVDDLFINLIFNNGDKELTVLEQEPYPVLPVMDVNTSILLSIQQALESITNVLDDSNKPINEILVDLKKITENVRVMSSEESFKTLPDDLKKTMEELTLTLQALNKIANGESKSALSAQITETLKRLGESSKELQQFLRTLNNKPNSLIFGDR